MSTSTTTLRQKLRDQLWSGPNAAVKQTPGWRRTEAVWGLVVLAWFGTTGRPRDIAVAVGLIIYWVFGPAAGVFLGGNLLILALGVLPTALLPLLATELILFIPVVLEVNAATTNRPVVATHNVVALLIVGTTVVGAWGGWSVGYLIAIITGGYVLGVVGLQVMPELYGPQRDRQADEPTGDDSI